MCVGVFKGNLNIFIDLFTYLLMYNILLYTEENLIALII